MVALIAAGSSVAAVDMVSRSLLALRLFDSVRWVDIDSLVLVTTGWQHTSWQEEDSVFVTRVDTLKAIDAL